jgi:hypothetical protein
MIRTMSRSTSRSFQRSAVSVRVLEKPKSKARVKNWRPPSRRRA